MAESVIEYRVMQLEKKITELENTLHNHSGKMENLLKDLNSQLAAYLQRTGALEIRHSQLAEVVEDIKIDDKARDEKITNLQAGTAERVVPGAVAGTVVSGIIELARFLTGH